MKTTTCNPQTLFLTVGIPGSGKTILSKIMDANKYAIRISSDDIRQKMNTENKEYTSSMNVDVFAQMLEETSMCLRMGESVVLDACFIKRKDRAKYITVAHLFDVRVIALCFPKPIAKCLADNRLRERPIPDEVITRYRSLLEYPTNDEFDYRIFCNEYTSDEEVAKDEAQFYKAMVEDIPLEEVVPMIYTKKEGPLPDIFGRDIEEVQREILTKYPDRIAKSSDTYILEIAFHIAMEMRSKTIR